MKKVLAVMLSMMFAVSLAACGNSGVTASNAASETVAASKTESNADSKPEDSKAESSQEDGASQSEDAELVVNNQDKDVNSTRSNDLQLEIVKEEMVEGYNTDPYAIMDADAYVVTIKNNNPMDVEDVVLYLVGYDETESATPVSNRLIDGFDNWRYVDRAEGVGTVIKAGEEKTFAFKLSMNRIKRVDALIYSLSAGGQRYCVNDSTRDEWIGKIKG